MNATPDERGNLDYIARIVVPNFSSFFTAGNHGIEILVKGGISIERFDTWREVANYLRIGVKIWADTITQELLDFAQESVHSEALQDNEAIE